MPTNTELLSCPIPTHLPDLTGWKQIPIIFNPVRNILDPLVPLGQNSNYWSLATMSVYAGETTASPYSKLDGSCLTIFVRRSVAQRLLLAQSTLPHLYKLVVYDGWRSLPLQASLFKQYSTSLAQKHPDLSKAEIKEQSQRFVSLPSFNPRRPSPHNTGGAVDLILVKLDHLEFRTQSLDFGAPFDHAGPSSQLNYFETNLENPEAKYNRRLLYNSMTKAGFTPYPDEYWHFNAPETQMGARSLGKRLATMGAINLSPTNLRHEALRLRQHTKQIVSTHPTSEAIHA